MEQKRFKTKDIAVAHAEKMGYIVTSTGVNYIVVKDKDHPHYKIFFFPPIN